MVVVQSEPFDPFELRLPYIRPAEWVQTSKAIDGSIHERGERSFFHNLVRRGYIEGVKQGDAKTSPKLFSVKEALVARFALDLSAGVHATATICEFAQKLADDLEEHLKARTTVPESTWIPLVDLLVQFPPHHDRAQDAPRRWMTSEQFVKDFHESPSHRRRIHVQLYRGGWILHCFIKEYWNAHRKGIVRERVEDLVNKGLLEFAQIEKEIEYMTCYSSELPSESGRDA